MVRGRGWPAGSGAGGSGRSVWRKKALWFPHREGPSQRESHRIGSDRIERGTGTYWGNNLCIKAEASSSLVTLGTFLVFA